MRDRGLLLQWGDRAGRRSAVPARLHRKRGGLPPGVTRREARGETRGAGLRDQLGAGEVSVFARGVVQRLTPTSVAVASRMDGMTASTSVPAGNPSAAALRVAPSKANHRPVVAPDTSIEATAPAG